MNADKISAESFLISVFKYSVASWVNFLIYGVAFIASSWLLTPDVLGPVNMFITVSTLIMNGLVLGLDHSYIRYFSDDRFGVKSRDIFGICFSASTVFVFAVSIIASLFFASPISQAIFGFSSPLATYMIFANVFCLSIARFINITYRMEGNIRMYSVQSIALQFFTRVFFLTAAFINPTFEGVIVLNVIGMAIFTAIFWLIKGRTMLPKKGFFKPDIFKSLFKYGIALCPTSVLLWLNTFISQLIVSRYVGDFALGIFTNVSTVSNIISVLQAGFATFWSAFIYQNYKTAQKTIIAVHDYLLYGVLFAIGGIIIFWDLLFMILGPAYASGASIMGIMLLSPTILIISETTVYGITIEGKSYIDMISMIICTVTNILGCVLLVPQFGITGAAYSLFIANLVMFVFRTFIAQRFYRSIKNGFKTTVGMTLLIISSVLATIFYDNFALKAVVGVCLWAAATFVYRAQFTQALGFIKGLFNRGAPDGGKAE